jgi:hypothetical protein
VENIETAIRENQLPTAVTKFLPDLGHLFEGLDLGIYHRNCLRITNALEADKNTARREPVHWTSQGPARK